ncbi:MAG: nucleotidyltransferase [Clostridia bacterium]|nr:nucleotidyltransferase [Clostridia bacterium]
MGSRYGGLKQIDPITPDGEFIIDFSVYDAIKAGFDRVVFIIKEENYEDFRSTIGKRIEGKIKVEYAFQALDKIVDPSKIPSDRVKPWGTNHAVLCAKDVIGTDSFAVINSDDFYGRDAYEKAAEFIKNTDGRHFCMIGYRLGNTLTDNGSVARGICHTDGDGMLTDIVERTKIYKEADGASFEDENGGKVMLGNDTLVSMNFWGFTSGLFEGAAEEFDKFINDPDREPLKSECYLPNVVGALRGRGYCDVKVIETSARWYGVTYHDDKPEVVAKINGLIESGVYPRGLWK